MNSFDIQRVDTNPRMSKAVVHAGVAYLCGQVGNPGDSIELQTSESLSRVDSVLASIGSDKSKLLQVTVWLRSMQDFHAMNSVWELWLPMGAAPARACGEVALARDDLLVEFKVIAAV